MKKNIILSGLLIFSCTLVFGQLDFERDSEQVKTLFSAKGRPKGYGAFDLTMTQINGRNTLLTGGHGGLIFDKKYVIGFGGAGIASSNTFQGINPANEIRIVGGYGGLNIGYILNSNDVFHLNFPMFLGIGGLQLSDPNFEFDPMNPYQTDILERTIFYIVQPGVTVETNVTKFFRIALGVKYRFTQGAEFSSNNIYDEDISGLAFDMSFKLGLF